MRRPAIGICTALEHARWTVWEREAFLLSRAYIDAIQAAGGRALMIPPDPETAHDADAVLDGLDGLILAGGADVRVVQELLGHASVATTQLYTHVTVDTLREVYATSHPRARG